MNSKNLAKTYPAETKIVSLFSNAGVLRKKGVKKNGVKLH